MNESTARPTAMSTFIVRFWQESSASEMRWRGRIEHVQSGESATFLTLEGMLGFLQGFGLEPDDTTPHALSKTP
ncbi:MAG: hypothetical protein RRC07_12620 [Anaerolineae bacterium]|nr:hypothetical protein [Anaerolineae bacterium]